MVLYAIAIIARLTERRHILVHNRGEVGEVPVAKAREVADLGAWWLGTIDLPAREVAVDMVALRRW